MRLSNPIAQAFADAICTNDKDRRLLMVGPENHKMILIPNLDPALKEAMLNKIETYKQAIKATEQAIAFSELCKCLGDVKVIEE